MATSKEKVIHVAVVGTCGLEVSSKGGQPLGVGKSALCNRFVRPLADQYKPDIHKTVISNHDFKNHVINSDHFLYWGDVSKPSDYGEIAFSVIEHTEFLDDRSYATLEGSSKHPYTKRCGALKLTSPGKLVYIDSYHQLGESNPLIQSMLLSISRRGRRLRATAAPQRQVQRRWLPRVVFDVNSSKQGRPVRSQLEFLEKLHKVIAKTKKPVVIVATKCDDANDDYLQEARAFATCYNLHFVETSAHKALNVDRAFITLAQLIDKTKGEPRTVLYTEAFRERKELLDRIIDGYEQLLESDVTSYHQLWLKKSKEFQKNQNFLAYVKHIGTASAKKLFEKRRRTLREELIEKRRNQFLSTLLKCLEKVFPDVSYMGDSWEACKGILTEQSDFDQWFVVMSDEWQNSQYLETEDIRIPYDFLDTDPEECEKVFEGYVERFMEAERGDGAE